MRAREIVQRLQLVDRRIVYALLVLVLALPFIFPYKLPIYPDRYTRQTYQTIEKIADDPVERNKVVLVLSNWGPGSEGENGPQIEAVFRHLLRRRVPFVLCSTGDAVTIAVAETRLEKAIRKEQRRAAQRAEPLPTWTYGEDYINFGFIPATVFESMVKRLILDTRASFKQDFRERKAIDQEDTFPILRHFHGVQDISLVFVISAGDEAKPICGIVQRQASDLRVAQGTMGIVANDLYPYMKSGQLCGLLNSARAAVEYTALLGSPETTPLDNSMSTGKLFLLALVVLGNVAFLVTRRAEKRGVLRPLKTAQMPMPPLSGKLMWGLFISVMVLFVGTAGVELFRVSATGSVARDRVPHATDDPTRDYPRFERVDPAFLEREQPETPNDVSGAAARRTQTAFAQLIQRRAGEFIGALLTLGIFAFLLGDNRFYRFTEALIIGCSLGFGLPEAWDKFFKPKWIDLIWTGLQAPAGSADRWAVLWVLMVLPGCLWYFVYSKKYRWLNQLLVALFVGLTVGPEFGKQAGLMVPQILDCLRPVWPFTPDHDTNVARVEHLVFMIVMVLSLLYFIFFLRPKTRLGRGTVTAGRIAMMLGFGAMFGNTVNTRMSWLAPRIGVLIQDWLGKLFA
jgi:hypothetical protein